ncbi:MAG TPA: hypothetical protein VMZ06_10040 [Candidatus Bathyarchaeia archaeon]|nr:hypothetical protein [Candidatus Bathyarchaeia archaeon]
MTKSKARRNVIFVLLCFFAVAILLVLAHVKQSRGPILEPESPEVAAFRLDRAHNAWYTLQDAVQLLPLPPPAVQYPDGPGGRFVKQYEPVPESLARMVWATRPDDEVLLDYLAKCRPAIDKVREALLKPDLMFPMTDEADERRHESRSALARFTNLLEAIARVEAASPRRGGEVAGLIRDVLRLEYMISSDYYPYCRQLAPELAPLFRSMSLRRLRQTVDWLTVFRRSLRPATRPAEQAIRQLDALPPDVDWAWVWRHPGATAGYVLMRARQKAILRRHHDAYIATTGVEMYRLRLFETQHPALLAIPHGGELMPYRQFSYVYSEWLAQIDGLAIAAALEIYRCANGQYPESLESLRPYFVRLPVDPFTGKPFIYRRQGTDYVLYSCGPDQKDSGGAREIIIRWVPAPVEAASG